MSTYRPHTSTIAHRILVHLASLPEGTKVTSGVLADAVDTKAGDIRAFMQPCLDHGFVTVEKVDGLASWELISPAMRRDYAPDAGPVVMPGMRAPKAAEAPKAPAMQPAPARTTAPREPQAAPRPAPQATPATPQSPGAFCAAVWSDGRLVLQKGEQQMELDVDQVRTLIAYLERMVEVP